MAEALKEVEKPGTHDLWLFDVCSVQVGHLQGMQRKTALSRNVAMGSKSYSQSRMKSSGSSKERLHFSCVYHAGNGEMMTMDWQSHARRGLQGNSARLQQGHIQSKKFNAAWPLLKVSLQ